MEEADFLLINKVDLLSEAEVPDLKQRLVHHYPFAEVFIVCARTGEGIDGWLSEVICSDRASRRIAVVDYDLYAEGEAVLGWLKETLDLSVRLSAVASRCLSPGRPAPTYRYERLISLV